MGWRGKSSGVEEAWNLVVRKGGRKGGFTAAVNRPIESLDIFN
jgi:hypothetical protein